MILECNKCALSKHKCISGEGPKPADIMIIGQSLGPKELRQERLFVGKSGELLNNILSKIGLDRKNIYITNIVKGYIPPGQTVSKTFIRICSKTHLENEIKEIKPKVIICLGAVASSFFGKKLIPNSIFFNDEYNCHVITTHHPARLLRSYSDKLRKEFTKTFEKAIEIINGSKTIFPFNPDIKIIDNEYELNRYNNALGNIIAVDLETTGLNFLTDDILTVGISDGIHHLGVKFDENTKPIIKEILEKRKIVGQNFKFDYKFLLKEGISLYNNVYFDTKLAHFLVDRESPHNLEALALKYLHTKLSKGTIDFNNRVAYTNEDFNKYCTYVANDAAMTFEIYKILKPIIDENFSKVFNCVLIPSLVWLAEAEYYGVKIDRNYVEQYMNSIKYKLKTLETDIINDSDVRNFCKIYNISEFNIRSPKQLCGFLYDYLGLESSNKNTAENTIIYLIDKYPNCEFLKKILEYRQLHKSYTTYLVNLLKFSEEDGNIHCEYDQCRTPTGRLSAHKPNTQNIPKGGEIAKNIRRAFIARDRYTLIEADYKQIEFRCLAHLSRDKHMIELINEGKDIHRLIASLAYMKKEKDITDEERRIAKTIVFGLMYGRGEKSIAEQFKISIDEARNIKTTFFGTFREAGNWIEKVKRFAKQNGYVKNLFGRKIEIPQLFSKNKDEIAYGLRCAINYPIQGTAADITNFAGGLIFKKFKELNIDARLIMNIHDALVIECRDEIIEQIKELITKIMTEDVRNLINFRVKLEIDIEKGKNLAFGK